MVNEGLVTASKAKKAPKRRAGPYLATYDAYIKLVSASQLAFPFETL